MQRPRALVVGALALACLLAGCSAGPTGEPPSVTPAEVPSDTVDKLSLPQGVRADGTVDGTAVADAHRAVLEAQTFTLRVDRRQTLVVPNGDTLSTTTTRQVRVGAEGRFIERETVTTFNGGRQSVLTVERYGDGRVVYVREETADGLVSYHRLVQPPSARPDILTRELALYLRLENASVERTVVDGRVATTVAAIAVETPAGELPGRYHVTVDIRDGGLAERFAVDVRSVSGGDRRITSLTATFEAVGATTVEEPAWLERARTATSR